MMWWAWFCVLQEIDAYGIEYTYSIGTDGDDEQLDLKQVLRKIVKESEELNILISDMLKKSIKI